MSLFNKIFKLTTCIFLYTLLKYGGPDGELGASMRYISQRYTMPDRAVAGLLTDIGTEESAHLCCILYFQINFQIILIHVIVGIIIILYFTYKTF